tara:strand:+ start:835 stop:1257 length:423 start_codon:yes stop_codon:yes gene_type:complete
MNNNEDYFAYGHYGFYKKEILDKMMNIGQDMVTYLSLRSKSDKFTPDDLSKVYNIPYKLQIAIIELIPKLSLVKDNDYVKDIGNILNHNNLELLEDRNLFLEYYKKYVTLIELLGYSDMNVKREMSNPFVSDYKEEFRAR